MAAKNELRKLYPDDHEIIRLVLNAELENAKKMQPDSSILNRALIRYKEDLVKTLKKINPRDWYSIT